MNIEPNWDFYRSFLTVLQQGSLSAAARELGLTQPTIGRHVDALEMAIGAELFTRSPNGLLPTDAALALKPYAETLAATTAALLRTASGERQRVAGTVRVSASEVIAVEVLPGILGPLQETYPELQIELSASDAIEDLVNREADIAVRMAEPKQGALVVRRIGDIPLGFHAHRRYLEQHGIPQTLAEIANHRLIGFDRQTAYVRMVTKRYEVPGINFSYRTDSNLAQLSAIRAGIGIGICQTGLARQDPDLVHLLPDAFRIPLGTWVAMHESLKTSPRCRAAFDALVKGLQDYHRYSTSA
ncbi:LysR family transcriptional regulator [Rhizobium hidalgonense]|uniref:LysR family transcriptional regulator n=1 Tax=Rhizobium hidalgonense TaxID=1538159 RepID=A0A2A6KBZ7_9HYPH|nr:LysR family transcriptional regulator [Rhizobium hidalgonense]MDR9772343.1 LysR family transcriptional regulator [Rhizobium hidalgonense]MDR9811470.1 LysR family transcriptional regulator [Rhizobium hidalgonense]MDR9821466.1 LysR family transcriptional regulator [Rhizobium hidalgonense]PDT22021.1 LysR family transcriptional regulator [Rhizobium hidalgonense]PON08682.1 LysR family transcriptional regulator [Rhizobium hidalgonense]